MSYAYCPWCHHMCNSIVSQKKDGGYSRMHLCLDFITVCMHSASSSAIHSE